MFGFYCYSGVVGAIDGTHIPIPEPNENGALYYNRKNFPSILLQGICDNSMKFVDCYAGEVGSVHDALVYRRSDFYQKVITRNIWIENDMHIIGDAAYPLSPFLMVPYKNFGDLLQSKKYFNDCLSRIRSVIERAFALLKGRFRRLKYLDMSKIEEVPIVIIACCILHNICLLHGDWEWVELYYENLERENGEDEEGQDEPVEGTHKRDEICADLWQRRINNNPRNLER
jgi:hypothetical protein